VVALLTTILLYLQSLFTSVSSPVGLTILFVSVFVVVILVDYMEHRVRPSVGAALGDVLRSCVRDSVDITTVAHFLADSREEDLVDGDEVHVLTNSLEGYDLSPAALRIIAENVREGVRYIYYLPGLPTLAAEKDRFVHEITTRVAGLPATTIDERLRFYRADEDALYSFAVVSARAIHAAYWYITTPSRDGRADPELVILKLRRDLRDRVIGVMTRLRRRHSTLASTRGL
jgi:hypothetical protein